MSDMISLTKIGHMNEWLKNEHVNEYRNQADYFIFEKRGNKLARLGFQFNNTVRTWMLIKHFTLIQKDGS